MTRTSRARPSDASEGSFGSRPAFSPLKALLNSAVVMSMSLTLASAQNVLHTAADPRVVPIQMVVTAEPFRGSEVPPIGRGGIRVLQNRSSLPVTEWISLQGDMAGLELYVLIDEKVNSSSAARIEEIRQFVASQATTTAVGIAYMDNGEARIAQTPTTDHDRAAEALRQPTGDVSAVADPFTSLRALIDRWSAGAPRREVLIVTDGVDIFEEVEPGNVSVEEAIKDAQFAGVQVFCFYAPGAGHSGHSPALIHGGQALLARLAEQTGGEAYFKEGDLSPSFEPYLADMAKHLAHQYLVTFLATPVAGQEFQRIRFSTKLPNVEVVSAHHFHLDAEASRP